MKTHNQKVKYEIDKYFGGDPYRYFIFLRTYSRWREDLGRRETWTDTVDRYMKFMYDTVGDKLSKEEYEEIREYILHQKVMPSMRLLWSAGEAVKRSNVCVYNCSFIIPKTFQDFGEILYLLTCGCGVGFSVEKQFMDKFPVVEKQTGEFVGKIFIDDSREGWADSIAFGLETWFKGKDVEFKYDKIRPLGSRLKTFGGRASGHEPLKDLLDFSRKLILSKQGKKLKPIDFHDIICKIGQVVVAGGVRRSSLISLSDLDDLDMRKAKTGKFFEDENTKQRVQANNSVAYKNKITKSEFLEEWNNLKESRSGERGIFNRFKLPNQIPDRRLAINLEEIDQMGVNPCGEIYLRNKSFCNLSEVVARESDSEESLLKKIKIATIIGTFQATLTNFDYLSSEWKKNCDEERLLGVSITGQFDCPVLNDDILLRKMKKLALEVNKEYSKKFEINESVAITCVKPSGTVSQLVNSSSGSHPRYAKNYIRRVEISETDPLFKLLKDQGIPSHERGTQKSTHVLEFPVKAPESTITKNDITALEQLEWWRRLKVNFTEHNPSVSIYIAEDEWDSVADWLHDNWDIVGGLSFFPKDDHVYKLAPYEEINDKQYNKIMEKYPKIDFGKLAEYEQEDNTNGGGNGCEGDSCEIEITDTDVANLS